MREKDWVSWLSQNAPLGDFRSQSNRGRNAPAQTPATTNDPTDFFRSDLIGDDAAALPQLGDAKLQLICADMIVDGVHFRLDSAPARLIGRKALAVNLSDIAAMGGRPSHAVVTLSVPLTMEWGQVEQVYQGLFELAEQYNVAIVGGDTTRWPHPLTISVTVCGAADSYVWRRGGAVAGDQLFVSGDLGGSLEGKHLDFEPRLGLVSWLQHESIEVHAAIDLSDGLGIDLERMCDASRCGTRVYEESIPISAAAFRQSTNSGNRPVDHALGDGEDFELLVAVPAESAQRLLASQSPVPLTQIGEITASPERVLIGTDGVESPWPVRGYDHLDQ